PTVAKLSRQTAQKIVDDRQDLIAELKAIRSDVLVDDERRLRLHGTLDLLEGVLELLDVMKDRVSDDDVIRAGFESVTIEVGDGIVDLRPAPLPRPRHRRLGEVERVDGSDERPFRHRTLQ